MRLMIPFFVSSVLSVGFAQAQVDWDAVEVSAQPVRGAVHVIFGRGGNIGLCVGEDGTFLVDDQYAPLTDSILAAVETVTDDPVRFLVNTHWHGDHTGGNENFGKRGSIIVAHQNVRRRLSTEQVRTILRQDRTEASPPGAWPKITFTDEVTFYWNGEEIRVFHVAHAHTDGDSIIHFAKADVFHMGDVFFNGMYPFIDIDAGGNVKGVITAADRVLEMTKDTTMLIPGHGEVGGPSDLLAYRNMLATIRDRVQTMVDEGKSMDEIVAAKPHASFDANWTGNSERLVRAVYYSLTR